ncbi:hypothetical protein NC652_041750 [Populus alba x Populus x berolinensis]|nr:hypothetical protein NC652_041750 [Populus alba x Populus x berolinensis]
MELYGVAENRFATASTSRAHPHLDDDTLPPTICPLEFLQSHANTCWLGSIDEGGITEIVTQQLRRQPLHTFPLKLFSTPPNHFPNPQNPPFE